MAAKKKTAKKRVQKKKNGHLRAAKIRGEVIDPSAFKGRDATWRIFRIMAEFVDGYEFLSKLSADVTIFGSARTKPGAKYYKQAVALSGLLAKEGLSVITGGGPGIMEAANKGAHQAGGESIGLNIQLPFEQRINKYVRHGLGFHFFFTRKVMLTSPSQAFIAFPGGFGTMDEVFEVMTLVQTHKMQPVPIVLYGADFWTPMVENFIRPMMVEKYKTISPEDIDIFHIVDTPKEAVEIIRSSIQVPDNATHDHSKDKK